MFVLIKLWRRPASLTRKNKIDRVWSEKNGATCVAQKYQITRVYIGLLCVDTLESISRVNDDAAPPPTDVVCGGVAASLSPKREYEWNGE